MRQPVSRSLIASVLLFYAMGIYLRLTALPAIKQDDNAVGAKENEKTSANIDSDVKVYRIVSAGRAFPQ